MTIFKDSDHVTVEVFGRTL